MRLARLSAFLCFLCIVGWNVLATTTVIAHAQAIGTHLGQGDITAQVELMNFLATKVKDPKNFPITVMLELGAPGGDVTRLADAVKQNGFPAIVRINLVCQANRAGTSASFVSTVRSAFGAEAAIVWGNEINNETECANLNTFATSYGATKGAGGRIGPATLDFYHPNDAVKLLSQAPLSGVYGGAPVYFSNAYGCQGGTVDSCDVAGTDTQNKAIVDPKGRGPFYLTEFSLSPGPKDATAPDADLKKVVEFIETRAGETGALGVTPLIRNVCSDEGDWLIFVSKSQSKSGKSEVYTFTKSKVDIDSCSTTGKDPYYLYPIPALFDTNANPDEQKQSLIKQLNEQGYQAQCLSPATDLKAVVDGLARSELYNTISPNAILATETDLNVNFEASKIPGWRLDGEHDLTTINSLETLFGFRSKKSTTSANAMSEAIVYSSLGLVDQCIAQSRIVDTVRNMCNKLEKPDACALNQTIIDSEYDIFTLQTEMNTRIEQQATQGTLIPDREKARRAACEAIVKTNQNSSSPTFKKTPEGLFQTALQNTPLFLPKAYRLGFLVVVVELEGTEPVSDLQPFRFLRKNEETALPKHEVRVFTFKMPDTGTNKDTNSDIYYQDPTELTRNVSLSKQQQDVIEKNYRTLLSAENQYSDASMMPVLCDAQGSSYCRLPGVQALVEYVNKYLRPQSLIKPPYLDESIFSSDDPAREAQAKGLIDEDSLSQLLQNPSFAQECGASADEIPYQDITTIFSAGSITEESEGQIFAGENDLYEGAQKAGISQSFPAKDAPAFAFLSQAKARKDGETVAATGGKDLKIYSYLIVPQGFQLGVTEDTIAGRFLTEKQKKTLFDSLVPDPVTPDPEKQISKYFSIQGITSTLEDIIKQSVTVIDPLSCTQREISPSQNTDTAAGPTNGNSNSQNTATNSSTTGRPTTETSCSNLTIAIKHSLASSGFMPRIHGGVLGEVMLNVQKSLLAYESKNWKYINSCKTVEEWILGTCEVPADTSGAPIASADSLQSVAICDGGSRITSGETAQHFIRTGNNPNQCYTFVSGNYSSYARPVDGTTNRNSSTNNSGNTNANISPSALALLSIDFSGDDIRPTATTQPTSQLGTLNETTQSGGSYSHFIERWRDPSDIPFGDATTFCTTLYSYAACTFNPQPGQETTKRGGVLLENRVNENGQWNTTGTLTACEYVVKEAAKAGVSPRFAIAMWGEESNFSAFRNASAFGITSQPPLDLEKQVTVFLNTVTNQTYQREPNRHLESGVHGNAAPYLNFLERYSAEEKGSNQFCTNKFFPAQLKTYYDYLSETSLRSRL